MGVWFWLFCGPALALALLSLAGERRKTAYIRARLRAPDSNYLPPATVIVPVKGEDHGLRENLAALAAQDYPDYELIVTARRADDIPAGVLPARVKIVLVPGGGPLTGEKISNLMAGVRAARRASEVLAFADSDGRTGPRWLRALAEPLADPSTGAATGFRWYDPAPGLWGAMRSVWNGAVAGAMAAVPCRFVWGGATAIRKETFFAIGVEEAWKNAISDDYRLAASVRKAGLRIVFAPGAMAYTSGGIGGRELFAWMRRQLMFTRFYAPGLWWMAAAGHFVYCGAMVAVAAACALGHPEALWALAGILGPGMLSAYNRARLFGGRPAVHALLSAPAAWLWLAALAASAFGRTIHWRGYGYVLGPGGSVRFLRRTP